MNKRWIGALGEVEIKKMAESEKPAHALRFHDRLSLAYALLRLTLGVNIFGHGICRILGGPSIFAAALATQFEGTVVPPFVIGPLALALPWLEASIGLLILVGAFTRFSLFAGALLMVVLTFGATVHQDWDIAGLQLTYAVAYFGLLALVQKNRLSLDFLVHSRSHGHESFD